MNETLQQHTKVFRVVRRQTLWVKETNEPSGKEPPQRGEPALPVKRSSLLLLCAAPNNAMGGQLNLRRSASLRRLGPSGNGAAVRLAWRVR